MHSKLDHVSIFSKHSGDQDPHLNDSFDKDVAEIKKNKTKQIILFIFNKVLEMLPYWHIFYILFHMFLLNDNEFLG